jgi:hypothetical protein
MQLKRLIRPFIKATETIPANNPNVIAAITTELLSLFRQIFFQAIELIIIINFKV